MNNKELALTIIKAGYKIIPCYPRGHERAKQPISDLVPSWPRDASKNEIYILRWFGGTVSKMIGIPCEINGFFAVDVDGPEGADTWSRWVQELGMSEPGPMQKTLHGFHYLFKSPTDFRVPGKVGALAAGIDLRGPNYICTGGEGSGYDWIVPITEPLPQAPQWLLDKIRALIEPVNDLPELTELAGSVPTNPDAIADYWFNKYTREARQGTRDDCAYRLGLQLYRSRVPIGTALNLGGQYIRSIPQPPGVLYTQAEYNRAIRSAYETTPKQPATLPREVTKTAGSEPKPEPIKEQLAGIVTQAEPQKSEPVKLAEELPQAKIEKIEPKKAPAKPKPTDEPKPDDDAEKVPFYSTWKDLDAVLGPIEWDWPGWLAKGFLHILVGMTGEGKSRIALRIGGTYLIGMDWPDGTPYECEKACVLWGEAEAGQAMNRDRAKFMNLPTDKILSPLGDPLGDFRLSNPNHLAKLAYMATLPQVKLIIVDSLSGADPTAEKSTEDAKNVNWLAGLARDVQKPIILTHHLRKRGLFDIEGEVSLDRVRGISTILQYARVIWAIDTPDLNNKETKRLSVIKSNLAKKPAPLGFTINDEITFTDAPEKPHNETRVEQATDLLLSLLEKEPKSAQYVLDEFEQAGYSKSGLYRAKDALGIISIRKDGRWLWTLPHKG